MTDIEKEVKEKFDATGTRLVEYNFISTNVMEIKVSVWKDDYRGDIWYLANSPGVGSINVVKNDGDTATKVAFIYKESDKIK